MPRTDPKMVAWARPVSSVATVITRIVFRANEVPPVELCVRGRIRAECAAARNSIRISFDLEERLGRGAGALVARGGFVDLIERRGGDESGDGWGREVEFFGFQTGRGCE